MLQEKVYPVVFEAEFYSVTPWWGGGPYGTVKLPEDGYWYPSSETIVGKTKWFARALKWTCSQNQSLNHRVLERDIRALFGYSKGNDELSGSSMFQLSIAPDSKSSPNALYRQLKEVPRVKLGLIGRGFLRYYDSPIDGVRFKAEVRVVPEKLGGSPIGVQRFTAAMMLTLAYAGIGRAANRGFGRFYPDANTIKLIGSDEIIELGKFIEQGNVAEAFKRGFKIIFGSDYENCKNIYEIIKCAIKDMNTVLEKIGSAFLYNNYRRDGVQLYKMASFGLPRKHLRAKVRGKDIMRAQSPIIASPVKIRQSEMIGQSEIDVLLINLNHDYLFSIHNGKKPLLSPSDYNDMLEKLKSKLKSLCGGGSS